MIEFKNRDSSNTNRRKLVIQRIDYKDNGEPKEMWADVYRGDFNISVEGTRLEAASLNEVFKVLNNSIDFLFRQYYTIVDSLNVSWTQVKGTLKTHKFRINMVQRFYGKVNIIGTSIALGQVTNETDYIEFEIKETQFLNDKNGTYTKIYEFYVELYLDESFSNCVSKLKGTVNYINTSTNPID